MLVISASYMVVCAIAEGNELIRKVLCTIRCSTCGGFRVYVALEPGRIKENQFQIFDFPLTLTLFGLKLVIWLII